MSNLATYAWLEQEPAPRILKEALALFGTVEDAGNGDSPTILSWARELRIRDYRHDETPWCGLFLAICAQRAGYTPPRTPLWALSWSTWGKPARVPMLGDVLVFERKVNGALHGHTGLYVGEDHHAFHVYGGNQNDRVCITRVARGRLLATRRCRWRIAQPPNVRPIRLSAFGELSGKES